MKKQLLLVDSSSYIFRAFYGIRAGLTNINGEPTNAVFGFKNMLWQLLSQEMPSHIAMVFDSKGKTFRNDLYPEYKANRSEAPDDLKVQFAPIMELTKLLNLPIIQQEGMEADDLIGTLVHKFQDQIDVKIISGDKDLTQLVTESVVMRDTMKDKTYDPAAVKEKFGVGPEMIVEYLALMGDSSDNIPGAMGIGPKTATKLFDQFGNIEGIYENIDKLKGKQKENLIASQENVALSLTLTQIKCDIELETSLEQLELIPPNAGELADFYRLMNFKDDGFLMEQQGSHTAAHEDTWDYGSYEMITDMERLKAFCAELSQKEKIAFDFETTSLQVAEAELVGISFAAEGINPVYIPFCHQQDLLETTPQIPAREALEILKPLFANPNIVWIGQNIKYEYMLLKNAGLEIKGRFEDSMISSYLLNANSHRHNLDALSEIYLGHKMISFEDVCGKGKKQITFDQVPLEQALNYAAEDSDATYQLQAILGPKLDEENLRKLYTEIEMPLTRALGNIELNGVRINSDYLKELSVELTVEAKALEKEIHEMAGEEFNLNSPKQLGEILFGEDKMAITMAKKKTKTGFSTDASVLEKLAPHHEIAKKLLVYRSKTKLINTYLDVLPTLVSPTTGRIHTSFSQVTAATGRLSSKNPNLQNIPIRNEDGKKIRSAFIPSEGCYLVSADYSQIELRFLAHLSEDEGLIQVFNSGGDIHLETAAAILDLDPKDVSSDQRRAAKAINFGIIYGMGAFRLAQEIGVSNREAKGFIEAYFAKYPKIKAYMDETIQFAQKNGYVETMFGRKRSIDEINSNNHLARTGAERVAVNTRIQGSAADLIKIAMIELDKEFQGETTNKIILQVHDEMVFEIEKSQLEPFRTKIKSIMENATKLKVPLQVDVGYGNNWGEAH